MYYVLRKIRFAKIKNKKNNICKAHFNGIDQTDDFKISYKISNLCEN